MAPPFDDAPIATRGSTAAVRPTDARVGACLLTAGLALAGFLLLASPVAADGDENSCTVAHVGQS